MREKTTKELRVKITFKRELNISSKNTGKKLRAIILTFANWADRNTFVDKLKDRGLIEKTVVL